MEANTKLSISIALAALLAIPCGTNTAIAQDAEFSQFYSDPVYLNPALAGTELSGRIGINFRNQWAAIDPNPYHVPKWGSIPKKKHNSSIQYCKLFENQPYRGMAQGL